MATLNDMDPTYIKSVSSLHSIDHLISGEPSSLQLMLEEAIMVKTGSRKDLSALVTSIRQTSDAYKNLTSRIEENKTTSSSDNELELDLLKEDLMCIVCNAMDVGAKNRLLECTDCHSLYHQECHRPIVSAEEADGVWVCQSCKDVKKIKLESSNGGAGRSSGGSSKSNSSNYRSSGSVISGPSNYKNSSSKNSSGSSHKTSDKNSSGSKSSSSRSSAVPNINVISADKRIQSMKKKAAKLHEKRY